MRQAPGHSDNTAIYLNRYTGKNVGTFSRSSIDRVNIHLYKHINGVSTSSRSSMRALAWESRIKLSRCRVVTGIDVPRS